MRIGILAAANSWYLRDLVRAAADRHDVFPLSFNQIHAGLFDERPFVLRHGDEPVQMDALLVRSMPPGSLEQVVFRMDLLHRVEAAGTRVLNPPRSLESAIDKFLTTAKIQAAGIPTPPTVACQTAEIAMSAFLELGEDVVIKPLFGGEGRGLTRVSDPELALRAFKLLEQLGSVIYLQSFVHHQGWDIRILLVGSRVFAMRRRNDTDWRTNVRRGARGELVEPTDEWIQLARQAAKAVGTPLAGVDILVDQDDRPFVLEVNAVPGWRALAKTINIDIAHQVLCFLEECQDSHPIR